jgi:hypothetical protein
MTDRLKSNTGPGSSPMQLETGGLASVPLAVPNRLTELFSQSYFPRGKGDVEAGRWFKCNSK